MAQSSRATILCFTLAGLAASLAAAQGVPGGARADSLFQAQAWPAAAAAYAKAAEITPGDARVWFRLGFAEHSQQHFDRAERAFAKASELYPPGPRTGKGTAFYNLAAARSRLGKYDEALVALDSALGASRLPPKVLEGDEDFAGLRSDPRFAARVRAAHLAFFPCDTIAHARDLDFWVGDWDVYNPAKQAAGQSSVQNILGGCVVLENWAGGYGDSGKSFNWYNTSTGEWQQTWVADQAYSTEYRGGRLEGNTMVFLADATTPQGTRAKTRLSLMAIDPNRVRQHFEKSTDDGKTWATTTDLLYVRRGSGATP